VTDVRAVALAVAVLLAGCTMGPDYSRPSTESPPAWRIDYPQAAGIANTRWWERFDDPALNQLIDAALRENRDLLVAAARVDQFVGQLAVVRSQFYPQIGYSADASRNRASRVGQPPLAPGADPYYTLYQGALSAQWQIDLFGRVRRQSESAQAQVYASEQGRRGVVLTIVTSVAVSYIALRALDRQLEIARATAANYADTARIFDLRFKGGVVSEVELNQVESQYQQALAAIPQIEQQIAAQENLLSVLLGRNPAPIVRGNTIDKLAVPGIPADLPSTLLERRPDILQAEQTLVAANANIGAAKALYFPTLSLTGLLGSVSTAFGDFLTGPATAWTVAAGLTGPIFTFGLIEGQVQSAEAFQREALASYQQVILNAFRETNDALVGTMKKREESAAQAKRVAALREYARLSRLRFDNGYAGYLEVLYAENELFGAELAAVRSQAERYTQLVNVFKAVGGGWVDEADRLAPQPQAASDARGRETGSR
jgi:multidrug efflux system outer membrane protein